MDKKKVIQVLLEGYNWLYTHDYNISDGENGVVTIKIFRNYDVRRLNRLVEHIKGFGLRVKHSTYEGMTFVMDVE